MFGVTCMTTIKGELSESKWRWQGRFWCPSLSMMQGYSHNQKGRNEAIEYAIEDYKRQGEQNGFLTEKQLNDSSKVKSKSIASLVNLKSKDSISDEQEPYIILAHQLLPMCLRPLEESVLITDFYFNNAIDPSFNFFELKEKNISSQLLLSWSSSINLAENYEIFLNNILNWSLLLSNNETLFYNCTSSWFGPFCRFAFDIDESYNEIDVSNNDHVTCYIHLNCVTSSVCLDWREICDRKNDCLDGSDEFNCWQLEINECAENEYRCHNGQCIPVEFFHDVIINLDCLDRTDEPVYNYYNKYCPDDYGFRCEEHSCRPGHREFPCGDGQCTNEINVQSWLKCENGRGDLVFDDLCSRIMACLMKLYDLIDYKWCEEFCAETNCPRNNCPSLYEFPTGSILFGHVRFMFTNRKMEINSHYIPLPDCVCYDEKLCADFLPATQHLNNLTCRHLSEIGLNEYWYNQLENFIVNIKDRFRGCLVIYNETHYCNYSTMYKCKNSNKCISKYRLVDGIRDCPFDDDETFNQSCSLNDVHQRFTCSSDNIKKCFAPLIIQDNKNDCKYGEDEDNKDTTLTKNHIYFQNICDGFEDLLPILIDGRNETDETECEHWLCNNTYTRCDRFWSCKDGADEINCPPSTCPEFQHSCVFPNNTYKVSCLPLDQAGDGIVDCLGAFDERNRCRSADSSSFQYNFLCRNDTTCIEPHYLCNNEAECQSGDDEIFCTNYGSHLNAICFALESSSRTEVENYFCNLMKRFLRSTRTYFTLRNMPTYVLQLATETTTSFSPSPSPQTKIQSIQNNRMLDISYDTEWQCNRGVAIYVRMNNGTYKLYCLCSPSYYGDRCQYQNQRVSLTVKIRVRSDWNTLFTLLITLIDNEGNIQSHGYIEYLPIRNCDIKFNIYLLYSTRPKNVANNYSVRIDAFNKLTLSYRASWIFPLRFPFLPVHRLSVLLIVPMTFCRCNPGWSGTQCSIKYKCDCAPNSLCIGDSICICPLCRFGPRCYLIQSSCQSESCANSGLWIPSDERYVNTLVNKSICICREEYSGDRCEYRQTQIDISFHKKITIPQLLFIHFITVQNNAEHIRRSIMKKIGFDQNSLSLYTSIIFNIAFVEFFNDYYLIILREEAISSSIISTKIIPSQRCASIHELFNKTFVNQHLLKRIKYYHIPCKERLNLVCFYDEIHFCLCDLGRRTNCFEFDHNMTYDCHGYNLCENGGQCFQNDPKCPTLTICTCRECYYGSRCQFSTKGSTLSLDSILGYQIHPHIGISRQSFIIKILIALTTIMLGLGFISSLFSVLTFQRETTRNVGCGLYLFTSSITSVITMSVFTVKFWFLLASQMGSINNRSFTHVQCVSIDFLLRLLLSAGDWLSACVAIERAMNVSKGINFDKAKSKQIAKWIILIVFLFTSCTHIHDPMHRHLIDDEGEQRAWCVTKYSPSVQMFDWALNILHFSIPFATNCISAVVIIITTARTRSNVQKTQSYKKLLREQFQHHKHLLISPFILVLLALPRLIISFLSGFAPQLT
ncbi:unnamed protein product [Rotaria sordida]|uniref:G-protein coupled receptors family 1 profile domain-containing protein n=1 Tax=Rotaria sordida TaxID=392033 RepID=A0A815SVV5_9BILA|nr:unnamed protein product [Rotaria sordida]CAF1493925.1 unnamed protein product [Rotaria sordida]